MKRLIYSLDIESISEDIISKDINYNKSDIDNLRIERNLYSVRQLTENQKVISDKMFLYYMALGFYIYIGYDDRTNAYVYARTLRVSDLLPKYISICYER